MFNWAVYPDAELYYFDNKMSVIGAIFFRLCGSSTAFPHPSIGDSGIESYLAIF